MSQVYQKPVTSVIVISNNITKKVIDEVKKKTTQKQIKRIEEAIQTIKDIDK